MKRMKRALTLSLATLMVFGSVTGNVNVIKAYALEKPAEVTEVPDLLPDGVAENVQAAKEASEAAQQAAKNAQAAVEELNETASDQIIKEVKEDIADAKDDVKEAALHAGFAEILQDRVTIMAEIVEWPSEIDVVRAEEALKRAEDRISGKDQTTDLVRAEAALHRAMARIEVVK